MAFNQILAQVCAAYGRCRWDSGAVSNYRFTASQVSTLDFFHPSDSDAESTGVLDGKIDLATAIWPRGRTMPPPEPIWIVFVTIVLMGCVLLAVRAFRHRRR